VAKQQQLLAAWCSNPNGPADNQTIHIKKLRE